MIIVVKLKDAMEWLSIAAYGMNGGQKTIGGANWEELDDEGVSKAL